MTISRQKIFAFVLIAVVFGSQTTSAATDGGFLGIPGLDDGADIGIIVGAVVLLIIIVAVISVSIYCCVCRKKTRKNEAPSNNGGIYPEQDNAQPRLTPNDLDPQQMFAQSPKAATSGTTEQITPTPQQQPVGMPAQSELQQQLLPTTQFPVDSQQQVPSPQPQIPNPPPPPLEPMENQPYFGALQSSIEPYLAQGAIARELTKRGQDLKGEERKNNENGDIEPEKPFYNWQPIIAPSPIATPQQPPPQNQPQSYPFDQTPSTPYQQTSTVSDAPTDAPQLPYQAQYMANSVYQQPDQRFMLEPRSASDYPYGYRSFLPRVAISPPTASTNVHEAPSVYSLSQHVDHPSTQQPPQPALNQGTNPMNQSTSERKLTRNSLYDYMLH